MQFGSMLVYCTVYDMCVWGAHINIFSGGPQSSSYGPANIFATSKHWVFHKQAPIMYVSSEHVAGSIVQVTFISIALYTIQIVKAALQC